MPISRLMRPVRAAVSMLLTMALLASCGGGVDSGGTGGAVAVGPISGFGSIIVNGIRFDISNLAIPIQDDTGTGRTRADLQLGTMTEVDGTGLTVAAGVTSAIASSIRIVSDIVGPVAAVDASAATFTVLGQTVVVTPATAFDARVTGGLGGLAAGSVVQVFGRYDAARQRYSATRVELATNPASYRLRGPVSAIDPKSLTLIVGGQTIDCSQLGAASLANLTVGSLVRVQLQIAPPGGAWIALALQGGALALPDRAAAQVEGRISAWSSSRQFSVDGIAVDASGATFNGSESAVQLGARVEVEGASSGGVLVARVVNVEGDENAGNSSIELYGTIDMPDFRAGTFTVHGVTVSFAGAVFESGGPADLTIGQRVKVEGVLAPNGVRVDAVKISFEGG